MPTYSYRCTECGNAFDVVQAFTDDSLTVCPSCGGRLRKLYSAVGVTFNGSGFYRTDSRGPVTTGGGSEGSGSGASSGSAVASGKESGQTASSKPAAASSSE